MSGQQKSKSEMFSELNSLWQKVSGPAHATLAEGVNQLPGGQAQDERFQALFENFPIALLEQDFGEVLDHLEELRRSGVDDFRAYITTHPEQLINCAHKIKTLSLNHATLELYEARSKAKLIGDITATFSNKSFEILKQVLIVLAEGGTRYQTDAKILTLSGKLRDVQLNFSLFINKRNGTTEARALVALQDTTERKQVENTLRDFIQMSRHGKHAGVFDALATQIAKSLHADFVLIGEASAHREGPIRTVSFVANGKPTDNFDYELSGSPCDEAPGGTVCTYPSEVAKRFPEDALLSRLNVQGFVGVKLSERHGEPIGLLAVMYKRPLNNYAHIESCVEVFSSQIAYELQRERSQADLRDSEARFRNLVDYAPMCIKELNLAGEIMSMNRFGLDLLGLDQFSDIAGAPFIDCVCQDDKARVAAELKRVYEGDPVKFVFRGANVADGHKLSTRMIPITSEDGEIQRILSVTEDVTERDRAKRALQNSRQRLRVLIDTLPDPVWLKDSKGRYLACNRAFEDFAGKRKGRILGRFDRDIDSPSFAALTGSLKEKAIASGCAVKGELEVGHASDERKTWFEIMKVPMFEAEGVPPGILGIAHDITERKRYEQFVQFQGALAKALIELPEISGRLSESEFILHGLEMLENLTNSQVAFLHTVDDRSKTMRNLALSRRTRESHDARYSELKHPDWNRSIWARAVRSKAPVLINDLEGQLKFEIDTTGLAGLKRILILPIIDQGHVVQLYGVANRYSDYSDQEVEILQFFANEMWRIIQRHRTEADAMRYNWVLEKSLHEIYMFDRQDLSFQHVNESARDNLGYSLPELKARTPLDLMPEFKGSSFASVVEGLDIDKKSSTSFTTLHKRKDGTMYPVEVNLQLMDLKSNLVLAIVRDIGDRVQMEHELLKLALAVEQSPVSILIANPQAEVEYVNEAFTRTTGFTREEVVGADREFLSLLHDDHDDGTSAWSVLQSGQTWEGEIHNLRKDGTQLIEREQITPIRQPDGAITHYLAIREDITEKTHLLRELENHRDHLEELVEQRTRQLGEEKKRAEAAGQAKSQFLANMSHEIRTPMNAILGLIYLLQNTRLDNDQRRKLEQIKASTKHLLSVINDILDLSKIEAGKLALHHHEFNVTELLHHVRTMLVDQANSKGLYIEVEDVESLSVLVGDRTRLLQILLNYTHNAIKFTKRGGVTLRARRLDSDGDSALVQFEVEDTGVGLDQEAMTRVFGAFEQADPSPSRQHEGTGLGLAIASSLAELMGGEVGVESEAGKGSTFWFTARLRELEHGSSFDSFSREHNPAQTLRDHYQGNRVLLVEDNVINLEVACEVLIQTALTVDTAKSGPEAIEKAQKVNFDLIFMDIQMPGMDGFETTRRIRKTRGYERTPIVAMSANSADEQEFECRMAGMDDYLAKPVEPNKLFSMLLEWLPAPDTGSHAPAESESRGQSIGWPTAEASAGAGSAGAGQPGTNGQEDVLGNSVQDQPPRSGGAPIDQSVLANLLGGDVSKQRRILREFREMTNATLLKLRAAHKERDEKRICFLAHKLKSSAGTVGAYTIAEQCLALELAGQSESWSRITEILQEIFVESQRLNYAVDQM